MSSYIFVQNVIKLYSWSGSLVTVFATMPKNNTAIASASSNNVSDRTPLTKNVNAINGKKIIIILKRNIKRVLEQDLS